LVQAAARIFREKRFRPLCCESTHFTTLTSRSPGHATSFRKECDRVSCRLKFCSVIRREKGILHAKTEPNPEKWKRKIKRSSCTRSADGRCDTAGPTAPASKDGSAHNFDKCKNTTSSCTCHNCGHFQCPRRELWALQCFFSVKASHFLHIFSTRDPKKNKPPTYNLPHLVNRTSRELPLSLQKSLGRGEASGVP